ncbi:Dol-P-Glc:Glc(2)Man(9)GlcNAc(2)-PP-Dol alpha-1,2-glucosyltransferase [Actinidia chinensis var. chinensis]|uniref:Dol-P-Glc:Glc(2)Man(9)GlcNAc(2)-PP-Dol alpha-1,2-glucosyltransferase n=1 Tax=Actinidia chinensis var. chinensis TaxID=1590841 RepID=A0A2R6PWZ9_ACTCC|nr:Dol-P-Glc:Glc(2)Man(9)GlcNAc(2)-PP-Dol alpha-1,2-glucosyltransferase [Actinidia chinensis var. chinensis]
MGRIAVAVIVSSWVIPISVLVNRIVPEPYMDEIFHVPQAQQYCNGNFRSWDPMITTPPGLYYISLAHVASLFPGIFSVQAVSSFSDACSPAILRSTNAILAVICSVLIYEIITQLRPSLGQRKATLSAVVLALYPLHWFFTFLYYTDVASLTAVLAMYLVSLKKNYLFSALLGSLAVFIRQTNIIWVLFVACIGVIECALACRKANVQLDISDLSIKPDSQLASDKGVGSSNLRKRRPGNAVDTVNHSTQRAAPSRTYSSGLLSEIQDIVLRAWHLKWKLLVSFSPFFMVLVAFVAFVRWNGSVVLGAKEAHTVSPHFAQLMYFGLVSALFMAPFQFSLLYTAFQFPSFWKNRLLTLFQLFMAFTAGFLSVHFFSIAHPYLLADNRHYTFYLWRKVINVHWSMKYLLVPLYVYSWFSIFSILAKARKKIWVLAYFLACAAVLIPAPLIEFRYYTIPFFFLVLHTHVDDHRSWLLMGIIYIVINIFTMFMFLFRPFYWSHEPGIQRFIW